MPHTTSPSRLNAIWLSIALGLCSGYLEVLIIVLKKHFWNESGAFETGADFPWTVPLAHAAMLLAAGLALAAGDRLRPGMLSVRAESWLLAALATWAALLRLPLYGVCSLVLAAGLARPISAWVAAGVSLRPRTMRRALAGLLGVLAFLATITSGRWAVKEHLARAALSPAPAGGRNVLLVVWDTVRASSLSLHGYPRDTTPNLARWARRGVRYDRALAPAPWTFPSHATLMTGQWPYQLNAQWRHVLGASVPTLASHLAARGYETAGFVANTNYCSYENGLNRGFVHYEDYALNPRSIFGRTAAGNWLLKSAVSRGDAYEQKWINLQSRDARGINDAFLGWLGNRRPDRPFFAFLNYFDAHDPYLPPRSFAGRFGTRPQGPRDEQFLINLAHSKMNFGLREALLARDCYDDCIASLDNQLGRLLDELDRIGLLASTVVIVTSDHGESFGVHGIFGHGGSLYLDEVGVPLVMLSPGAPPGRRVTEPVSLRDLPATVIDLARLQGKSPVPGCSLASLWGRDETAQSCRISPALSELAPATAAEALSEGQISRRFQMSLVAGGRHYVRDGAGAEQLYELSRDPSEMTNLSAQAGSRPVVEDFRAMLLKVLSDDPGSSPVEDACLSRYRAELRSLVTANPGDS